MSDPVSPRIPYVMSRKKGNTAGVAAPPSKINPPQHTVPHAGDDNVMLNRYRKLGVAAAPRTVPKHLICDKCGQRVTPTGCLCNLSSDAK